MDEERNVNISGISGIDYYESFSSWGINPDPSNWERLNKIVEIVPEDVSTIIDVGCGDGVLGNKLIEDGYEVTGADISQNALRFFRGKSVVASMESLPFKANSFDLVVSSEVLEHLPYTIYEKSLRELERIAKKYIIVSTPFNERLRAGFIFCDRCKCEFHRNRHVRSFNLKDHSTLFETFLPMQTYGISNWRMPSNLMLIAQQRLIRIYIINNSVPCLCCEYTIPRRKYGWLVANALRGLNMLDRLITRNQFRWICTKYERIS